MNHQLFNKSVSLVTLLLVLAFVANAQTLAALQPIDDQGNERAGGVLIESIKRGDLADVAKILFAGTSADAEDKEGDLPLCWAVRVNRRDIVELLLAKSADVNKEERNGGGTALEAAAAAGRADMVKLLLSHKATVNHKDHGGHTALIVSAMGAMMKEMPPFMVQQIMGEEPNEKGEQLRLLMGNEHKLVMELLLQAGADANAEADDCGLTALMVAALGGNVDLVKLLLDQGANVAIKNGEWDALGFAESFESSAARAELWETEDAETAQELSNWAQITAPGRQQVAKLLRAAAAPK